MGRIEVNWREGGKPYCRNIALFSSWNHQGRFNWYPANARLIKCRLADNSRFIYDPNGLIVGEYKKVHLKYTAKMRSIEDLIKMGATEI